jgi:hypothetical protein
MRRWLERQTLHRLSSKVQVLVSVFVDSVHIFGLEALLKVIIKDHFISMKHSVSNMSSLSSRQNPLLSQ